jgi:SAM-dependent methyltransferase
MRLTALFEKWKSYKERYGIVHASCAGLGRRLPWFWRWAGPLVTGQYRRRWLREQRGHIVNLGGGGNISQHWLTADIDPRADVFVDLTRPLPWPDNSLDGLFLEEVVEHVPASKVTRLFQECHRCLKTGKPIRITTPDLRWIPVLLDSECVPAGILRDMALAQIGIQDPTPPEMKVAAVNSIFREHGHQFIWDFASLAQALGRAGFRRIRRSAYRDEESMLGRADSHAHRFTHPPEMSLYIEGAK